MSWQGKSLQILSHRQAALHDSLSRSQRERLVQDGTYPQPIVLSQRRIGFVADEVFSWIAERIKARDHTKPVVRMHTQQADVEKATP